MKKLYENPEFFVIELNVTDILTESPVDPDADQGFGDDPFVD